MEIIDNEALTEKIGIVARQTDYDNETIMSVTDAEKFKRSNPTNNFYEFLSTSIRPNYIELINDISEYKKYNKYSTIAYKVITQMLNIQLKNGSYLHDSSIYDIKLVQSMNYDDIPTYQQFLDDLIQKRKDII